jgi:ferredoxin
MPVLLRSLHALVAALRADGYRVIGPTVRDGAIILAELHSADDLPYGWGVTVTPGGYRLRARDDRAAFGHAAGPQSWKSFLHPARSLLWTARRGADGGFAVEEAPTEPERYAFLGVRGCDLRAIAIQDRVLGGPDTGYARRREQAFIVAVNCTEPGEACFCASAGTGPGVERGAEPRTGAAAGPAGAPRAGSAVAPGAGPGAGAGYDLALTELVDGDEAPRYLVGAGSDAGRRVLGSIPCEPADEAVTGRARAAVAAAAGRMRRALPDTDLRSLLAASLEADRWQQVAERCLACGNCTMVCPTCFCTTVEDITELTGDVAQRWLRWDSCFDLDFSYLHGGAVRASTRGRYRQWLTHKFAGWHQQFGESGCVGCGRCIVWCPVGIDITEELAALAAARGEVEAGQQPEAALSHRESR